MKAPTWYDSDTSYNFTSFNNFINATMRTSSKVMTSSPADKVVLEEDLLVVLMEVHHQVVVPQEAAPVEAVEVHGN